MLERCCQRAGRSVEDVVCEYRRYADGRELDFELLAEAYALIELLGDDV